MKGREGDWVVLVGLGAKDEDEDGKTVEWKEGTRKGHKIK